jgi:ribosome modulation factor
MSKTANVQKSKGTPWSIGYYDRHKGIERDLIPYSSPRSRSLWLDGWDSADAEIIVEKGARDYKELGVGTILDNSIGCGTTLFYQVTCRKGDLITVRRLKSHYLNHNRKSQTCDVLPLRDQFAGDEEEKKLRLKIGHRGKLQIGPIKRMIWWGIWDGKPSAQWSA